MLRHDAVRRGARTFAHAAVAAAVLVAIPADVLVAAAIRAEVGAAGAFAALSSLLSWLHAELEDAGRLPDTRHDEGNDRE